MKRSDSAEEWSDVCETPELLDFLNTIFSFWGGKIRYMFLKKTSYKQCLKKLQYENESVSKI